MAEELFDHGGVCGGNWWNSSRNLFSSSPCSSATNETGSFGWRSSHELNMDVNTTRSSENSAGSVSDGSPTILRDVQKFQQQPTAGNWNQDFHLDTGRSEENYSQIVQASGALNSSMNYRHQTRGVDCNEIDNWNSKINFCGDFSVNAFKRDNQISFSLQQQSLASITECNETCQGLSTNFPLNSASYGYTSSLLRTLFDTDSDHPQQALFDHQEMGYSSATNFSNELISGFPKATPMEIKPSVAKQHPANRLQFSNNTLFWDATARPDFVPSTPSQYLTSGLNNLPTASDQKRRKEESKNVASVAKKSSSNEPALKHPRLETPSPLPTFKVRKEKLGDRITALQQLVSPFGKTDTASVLHEAIEYIKFLHDQVNVLSTPYLQNGSPPLQRQQDQEDLKKDLSSRGLSLVPISSTFPVAAENTSDFWTPSFGRSFR
ncbi:transcription factor bHLH112-like [Primulina huaijiensis]|uniref:transcription factor bHLH112-like n=1 Tax=Primulina huaijiensis TaxID=1492673 RepID=UPI003CC73AAD